MPAKLYERLFGPNGPQTIEELGEIPDAETRYKAHKELHKDDPPSNLPPFDVIDNGKEYDIFNVVADPAWQEKFRNKKPPLAYWTEVRKGRKAWLKKYSPAIPHGSKYRVYFNTPDGPLERVPAWATFIQPGKYSWIDKIDRKSNIPTVPNEFLCTLFIMFRCRGEASLCNSLGTAT